MTVDRVNASAEADRGIDRGAVLVHVAVALIALMAFSTFVVDYGVMWTARRQAQNAADAAALAGASAHAFDDPYRQGGSDVAAEAAFAVSQRHPVWGEVPNVVPATDITFPTTPAECTFPLESGGLQCLRVDVYRDASRGNALPVFFGQLVGVVDQGVRATATSRLFRANTMRCVRPWAIPDRIDGTPATYVPPNDTNPGSGMTLASHLGLDFTLDGSHPVTAATMTWAFNRASLFTLDLAGDGGASYQANISSCFSPIFTLGDIVTPDPDDMRVPTTDGVQALVNLDALATWNPGTRRIENSCAQSRTCLPYTISPRLVPLVVFDPKEYADSGVMRIVNVIGFFVKGMNGEDVEGAFTTLPGAIVAGRPHIAEISSFMKAVSLFR